MKRTADTARGRATCLRCRRASTLCYCGEIQPIRTEWEWVILQHPRERRRTVGTARIAHLGLLRSQLICGLDLDHDPRVLALIRDPSRRCAVLFPGPGSAELEGWVVKGTPTIFVLDGTWSTVKTLLGRNPLIASLPRVCFRPSGLSEYGFREQPAPHCLSTLEAVCEVLRLTEPTVNTVPLMDVFRKMVREQLRYTNTSPLDSPSGSA